MFLSRILIRCSKKEGGKKERKGERKEQRKKREDGKDVKSEGEKREIITNK